MSEAPRGLLADEPPVGGSPPQRFRTPIVVMAAATGVVVSAIVAVLVHSLAFTGGGTSPGDQPSAHPTHTALPAAPSAQTAQPPAPPLQTEAPRAQTVLPIKVRDPFDVAVDSVTDVAATAPVESAVPIARAHWPTANAAEEAVAVVV